MSWLAVVVLVAATALAPTVAADPGTGSDAADEPRFAETLAPGSYSGTLDASWDEDWYRLIAPVLTKVEVSVTPDCSSETVDVDLELYEGDGESLIQADTGGACTTHTVACWTNANQQLFTRVFTSSGTTGDYTLSYTQTPYDNAGLGTMPTPLCTVG